MWAEVDEVMFRREALARTGPDGEGPAYWSEEFADRVRATIPMEPVDRPELQDAEVRAFCEFIDQRFGHLRGTEAYESLRKSMLYGSPEIQIEWNKLCDVCGSTEVRWQLQGLESRYYFCTACRPNDTRLMPIGEETPDGCD